MLIQFEFINFGKRRAATSCKNWRDSGWQGGALKPSTGISLCPQGTAVPRALLAGSLHRHFQGISKASGLHSPSFGQKNWAQSAQAGDRSHLGLLRQDRS